jgi:predicted P-loop ATPase/GTPase
MSKNMGIRTKTDYVNFFIELNMGNSASLLNFLNNEKMILKHKLQNKESRKEIILEGMKILEELISEIKEKGESQILENYKN